MIWARVLRFITDTSCKWMTFSAMAFSLEASISVMSQGFSVTFVICFSVGKMCHSTGNWTILPEDAIFLHRHYFNNRSDPWWVINWIMYNSYFHTEPWQHQASESFNGRSSFSACSFNHRSYASVSWQTRNCKADRDLLRVHTVFAFSTQLKSY